MSWKHSKVSSDCTHHTLNDFPLYHERFDEVLPFHEPGLAPVRRNNEAWHIRSNGAEAYKHRFFRTFGFYEGLAAVSAKDGWHHIYPGGSELYPEKYEWCGNFQNGRCTVRDHNGMYFHITAEGKAAYDSRWRYAGDFRDGVGVVQSDSGCSTHIDIDGNQIHGKYFLDLDVFHKGFARARDDDGWTHINKAGHPVYERRFAAVEPFYNGQARVERFDGALAVIDESGKQIVEIRPALRSEFASLSRDMVGFWRTQTICTAVELGVFEELPNNANRVAAACGMTTEGTQRLLRALAEMHLTENIDGLWKTTRRGEYLKEKHPLTLADAAIEYGRYFTRMWLELPEALRADTVWQPPDIFSEVAASKDRAQKHHRMLMSYALHDYKAVPEALGLKGDEFVVDAGGGLGGLARLMVEQYPQLNVLVIDRPEVIEQARKGNDTEQVEFRHVDIFQPWGIKADAVVMARILHDWGHDHAIEILTQARGVLPVGGRIYVVEMLIPENRVSGSLCDLHLLMVTGGVERTAKQYAKLLKVAGFEMKEIRRIPSLPSIIVGVAI